MTPLKGHLLATHHSTLPRIYNQIQRNNFLAFENYKMNLENICFFIMLDISCHIVGKKTVLSIFSYGLRFKTISYTDLKNSNFNQREPPVKNSSLNKIFSLRHCLSAKRTSLKTEFMQVNKYNETQFFYSSDKIKICNNLGTQIGYITSHLQNNICVSSNHLVLFHSQQEN